MKQVKLVHKTEKQKESETLIKNDGQEVSIHFKIMHILF